jgi:hypothetical protein
VLEEAARQWAGRVEAVYDRVIRAGRGESLDEVKLLLAREWRAEFGTDVPESGLSRCAELLAEGRHIQVRPVQPGVPLNLPSQR